MKTENEEQILNIIKSIENYNINLIYLQKQTIRYLWGVVFIKENV